MSRTLSTVELPPAALARLASLGVEAGHRNERRALRTRAAYRIECLAGGCLLYRLDVDAPARERLRNRAGKRPKCLERHH